MNIILLHFAIKYHGDWDKIYKALDQKEMVSLKEINALEEQSKEWSKKGYNFKTLLDIDYPKQLKEAYKPPFVFWYQGDLNILKNQMLCISANEIEKQSIPDAEAKLSEIKKNDLALVNVDTTLGDQSLSQITRKLGINQVLVTDYGIENLKPSPKTLIISELPHDFRAETTDEKSFTKLAKNRFAAALSSELVMLSSEQKVHSNLISQFLNLGKEVSCFPKDASSKDYNNELIKQGANLVTSLKKLTIEKDKGRELS